MNELMSQFEGVVGIARLNSATYMRESGVAMPIGIVLNFESATIEIGVNDIDDTIMLKKLPALSNAALKTDPDLAELVGSKVDYVWMLTNHRGYQDGIELEFIDDANREFVLRIVAMASAIQVHLLPASAHSSK